MDRKKIICDYSKSEFMSFLEYDNEGKVLELFNEEGIDILKNYREKSDRLNYLLAFSKYRNELCKIEKLADLIIENPSSVYANIERLDYETSLYLFNRSIEQDKDVAKLFGYLKKKYKEKIIDNWNYSEEILYSILMNEGSVLKQKIIDNFDIDLSKINVERFISDCKKDVLSSRCKDNNREIEIKIPSDMITTKVKEKIWNINDIFVIRRVIEDANYITDNSSLNNYIKKKELESIREIINNELIEPFNTLYTYIYELYELRDKRDYDKSYELEQECIKYAKEHNMVNIYYRVIREYNDIDGLYNHLKVLSNRYVSNYIIDYFFEDNYHNVLININELLRYYYDGNMSIPMDRLSIYDRLSNIDILTNEEKIELVNELSSINIMELFYDDMLAARTGVATSLKENAINSDTLENYRNLELSSKYGIDIYTNENNSFYGIVKTSTSLMNHDNLPTGHSFSYVGDNNTTMYGGSRNVTLLYDAGGFNPEQLIHLYPTDSYTMYKPFEFSDKSTSRVNNLLGAEELIDNTFGYNEILILEEGNKPSPIDSRIPKLKPLAVYCKDEITDKDIEYAKENGLGIFLAKTKKKDNIRPLNDYRGDIDYFNYDYYEENRKDEFEGKRIK